MSAAPLMHVTGATGFIGRVLCECLMREGARVRAMARRAATGPWHEFVELDLADERVDGLRGVDSVFHLASKVHALSELHAETADYRRLNLEGTERLLAGALERGVRRFVFFSSVKAMGEGGITCLDESTASRPQTAYGRSKLDAERAVLAASESKRMHTAVLRLPPVYGPGCKGNLRDMLAAVAGMRFPPLAECANRRSFVHVDDVVRAALMVSREAVADGEVYIVCDDRSYSTRELYELMCRSLGRSVPSWSVPLWALGAGARVGDLVGRVRGRRFVLDSDRLEKLTGSAWYSAAKIERALGFRPEHSLAAGLREMVAHDSLARAAASTVVNRPRTQDE